MQSTRIGDFEVHRVAEFEGPFFPPADFFPDFDPEIVRANTGLLGPRLIEPASGKLVFSFHTFVVKTGKHTILIDSCLGNDKERPTRPQFIACARLIWPISRRSASSPRMSIT